MRTLRFSLLAPLGLALFLIGCPEDPPEGTACDKVEDCKTGELCKDGTCAGCTSGSQCTADYGAGATCGESLCRPAACVDGMLTCDCLPDSSCDEGECVGGVCVDCQRGAADCVCLANGSCDQGLRCNDQTVCEACTDGVLDCPCGSGDSCDDPLVCDNGVCTTDPCPRGSDGCPCETDDSCDGTLYCDDNTLCQTCSSDVVGCPCDSDQTCTGDLVCDGTEQSCRDPYLCTDLSCGAHQLCQERTAGVDALCLEDCESGYRWNSASCDEMNCDASGANSIADECATGNRSCVPQGSGGAICGDCLVGFTDESSTLTDCRAFYLCSDLDCATENRACVEGDSSTDAVCDVCLDGFTEGSAGCVESNCTAGTDGSIVDICANDHRDCVDPDDAPASCGDCTSGYHENSSLICQEEHLCDAGDLDCATLNRLCEGAAPLQYCGDCIEGTAVDAADATRCVAPVTCRELDCGSDFCLEGGPGEAASCVSTQCSDGSAYREDPGQCVSCGGLPCADSNTGETGRIWPYTQDASDFCICETEPDFYWDETSRVARPCDLDKDGWVSLPAKDAVESSDSTLRENARCSVRHIDRFILENELGQRKTVLLCDGSPSITDQPSSCASSASLPLYEIWERDDQNELENDTSAPAYQNGGTGRVMRAEELNSLTRACVNENADFNGNAKADMREWHGGMDSAGLSSEEAIYLEFSYYIELHRGFWQPRPDSVVLGQYVIQERPRCDSDFVLGYASSSHSHWRACTRSRDLDYDASDAIPDFGMDFARWSCDPTVYNFGSCPIPPPPTEVLASGEIPEHGLCRTDALPAHESECDMSGSPWECIDGQVWRGMSHHSQYACVKVTDTPDTNVRTVTSASIEGATPEFTYNVCKVACPTGDATCATDCSSGVCTTTTEGPAAGLSPANPSSPFLDCELTTDTGGNPVGLVAVNYVTAGGAYQRGCIDEWAPTSGAPLDNLQISSWRSMCPGWTEDPVGSMGEGNPNAFGFLGCGCASNYGGLDCEIGCPDAQLSLSPGYYATPRDGYWMCADFTTTGYTTLDETYGPALVSPDGSYVLRDEIGIPVDGTPLCESGDCATGYVIR